MTFIGNYWWAILAIAGAIIYTWRVVRRASRSANLGATEGADNQDTARAPALRLYLVVLAAAAVAARQVAANARRWCHNARLKLHIALPNAYYDALGVPRLAA